MVRLLTSHRWLRLLPAVIISLVAACSDAPTAPRAFVHPADGELWVAITVPAGVPQLGTWLPYVRAAGAESEPGLQRIRELRHEAEQARRDGRLAYARELEEEAIRVAVVSIRQMPEPKVLDAALASLDLWARRAETQVDLARFPQLDSAVAVVGAARAQAISLLARGDTGSAIFELARGAERIREQSPAAVALHVLGRAELRLAAYAHEDREIERAVHLLRSAREALLAGDSVRALRRALYALQIAERKGIRLDDAAPDTR